MAAYPNISITNLTDKAVVVVIHDQDQITHIAIEAEIGGTYDLEIDGETLVFGPVESGLKWYVVAGREFSVNGVEKIHQVD